jgi:hypothetical protein
VARTAAVNASSPKRGLSSLIWLFSLASGRIEAVLGSADIPEVSITSSTGPGVTHCWTNMTAFTERGR